MTLHLHQFLRFGIVGLAATIAHVVVFLLLAESAGVRPFWANIPAFLLAFSISYSGNLYWTFKVTKHHPKRLFSFLTITLLAFGLNQAILYWAVERLSLDHRLGLTLVVVLVPPFVFLAGRCFAFADKGLVEAKGRKVVADG